MKWLLWIIFRDGKYDLDFKNPASDKSKWVDMAQLTDIYQGFIKEFPIVSIEDPFDQDHWEAWSNITANTSIQVKSYFWLENKVLVHTRNIFVVNKIKIHFWQVFKLTDIEFKLLHLIGSFLLEETLVHDMSRYS